MKSTFRPKIPMTIERQTGHDLYGKPTFGAPVTVRCAPIRLEQDIKKTSIRTDKSGSQGAADEDIAVARILVEAKADIKRGDRVVCRGVILKVHTVYQRVSFENTISHWQVDCEIWPPE